MATPQTAPYAPIRLRVGLIIVLFFSLLSVYAQTPPKGNGKTESQIRQLEEKRFALMIQKDTANLGKLLADDLVYTHSSGVSENKEQYLQGIATGKSVYYAVRPEETKVRVYGNTAIINGITQVDTEVNGQRTTLHLKYTDVYVNQRGKWQMVAWQSLRLAQ